MYINFNHPEISIEMSFLSEFEKKVSEFILDFLNDEKTVFVQTSGSTGKPKIYEVDKQKMLNSAKMTCDFLNLNEENSALLCLPIEYISGKMMVVRAIKRKLNLKIIEPSSKPLENLEENIDFCAMTPLQVENSLEKIHFIKKLIIGGGSVSETLKTKIFQSLESQISNPESQIFETYGMTETLSHIALKEIYPNPKDYFQILDGISISKDDRGCLKISAPMLNDEELITNDLVEIKNEREFRFLGRIDHVINSGGAKIFPEELEDLMKKSISNELVFLGIPDEKLGQKLVLVIEGHEEENLKFNIQNLKFEKSFHHPKEIIFVEKIPRTPNGKIDRLKLLENLTSKI